MNEREELETLRAEVAFLKDQLAELRGEKGNGRVFAVLPRMSKKERALFSVLYRAHRVVPNSALFDTVWSDPEDAPESSNLISVYVFKLRQKLKPIGVEIEHYWGHGYWINYENKAKIDALVAARDAAIA